MPNSDLKDSKGGNPRSRVENRFQLHSEYKENPPADIFNELPGVRRKRA